MKLKWVITTTAIALLIFVAFLGLASHDSVLAAQDEGSKIEGLLLDHFTADGSADFIVRFTEQADLSAAYSMDWNTRGDFVYNTLRDVAANSQVNAKAILDLGGLKYHTFIGGNELYVWSGTLAVANELAALPEVSFIRATRTFYVDPYVVTSPLEGITWAGDFLSANALTTVGETPNATTDWGITDTKADQAWLLGARGSGIKVANIDTGVQWNHPALVNQFACASGNDPNCWEDPSNICGGTACDNVGHGTHTMGTMAAKDDPSLTYIAGMAPDATWIACKGCESSSCSDFALTSCADWILAPNGDPANRPNVVNNSWGGGGGDNWYLTYVNNWRADGIFPAFSAGNNSTCNSLGSPGDYQESFGSAAHDSARNIADFSSKGPSLFGDVPYTKPNLSAPGVNICSSIPTNAWSCGYSGTSMASPHTAGAVAQLWSCAPGLVGQIDATFQALQSSSDTPPAGSCGGPGDGSNYTFGYGYLDVLNLVSLNCGAAAFGTLQGHVYDQVGDPIEGATVTAQPAVEGNSPDADTDPNGFYTMDLVVGTYNVTASKPNYDPQTVPGVVIITDTITTQDFSLNLLGGWTLITPLPAGCPDWTRFDGEYYAPTGKAYLMGGRSGSVYVGNIYSYDPVANTCTDTGQVMPVPVANYTIGLINNGIDDLLCTFGGNFSATEASDQVQCYNPIANTVAEVSTLPGQLGQFIPGGVAVVDNTVYVFGGFRNWTTPYDISETWAYDPVANIWTQKGDINMARGYIDVAVVDGLIYGFGGDIFDSVNLVAQTITEVFDPVAGTWDDAGVAELTSANGESRAYGFDTGSAYEFAGKVIIAGGGQWPADTNAVLSYDVASDTYDDAFPDLVITRRDQAGFFVPGDPGSMWVFGGRSSAVGYGGDNPPYGEPEFFDVNVTTLAPIIGVTPPALAATLLPDATTTITLTVSNTGNVPLDWSITEAAGMKSINVKTPSGPTVVQNTSPNFVGTPLPSNSTSAENSAPYTGPLAVLYDQTDTPGTNGFPSQDFEAGYDTYDDQGADDFIVPVADGAWSIESVYVVGSTTGVFAIPSVNVYFYQDDAGLPGTQVYSALGIVPVDDGTANLTIDLPVPAVLTAGTYWLSVQAVMDFGTYGQFFWSTRGIQTNNPYAWVNPGDGFVTGCTTWSYGASVCGVGGGVDPDSLFRLEGTLPVDVPWLSENPTSGTVPAGESVTVDVTFDSTGLTPGQYLAALDVHSNDPVTPLVSVPVTLTVESADLVITKTDSLDPVKVGQDLTYTLLVTNNGLQDATGVTVVDTLPAGVTFVSASVGCTQLGGVVTCDVGALPMGEVASITIVVTPDAEGVISNSATVSGDQLDPDLANNTATQETTVVPATVFVYLPIMVK